MIKSWSFLQDQILQDITRLYTGPGSFECDPTFGAGVFYKKLERPRWCFDINPRRPGVIAADVRRLPLRPAAVTSLMFDPPFLPRTGPGALIKDHFGAVDGGITGLLEFYSLALGEIARVLKPRRIAG